MRTSLGFGWSLAAAGLLSMLPACRHHEENVTYTYSHVDAQGDGTVKIDGVVIEFDSSVRFRSHYQSSTPGTSSSSQTIEGHPFGVRDGVFFIGPNEYGRVSQSSKVAVNSAGVKIDGEERGALPASRGD